MNDTLKQKLLDLQSKPKNLEEYIGIRVSSEEKIQIGIFAKRNGFKNTSAMLLAMFRYFTEEK